MQRYILSRLAQALVCLIVASVIIFSLTRISGDPVLLMVPPEATEADIAEMRTILGLNKPIYFQYLSFILGALRGDFGKSVRWDRPCFDLFLERFPNTILLAVAAMGFAISIGISVGILSAVMVGRWFDKVGKVFAFFGQAVPVFWLGLMLMLIFSVWLGVLPTSGIGGWKNVIMPALTLGWYFAASLTRLTRSSMLDALDQEYIKMARIMGVSEFMVVCKHAFKNAIIPIMTLGAVNFLILLNGTVITETVFDWPGIGRLMVNAIFSRDYPIVQMTVLIATSLFICANLLVDIIYAYVDARIRYD